VSGRTAVVLFNLGGPDSPEAVEPFLFNLFSDPAIIRLPQPFRWLIARTISRRRAPVAAAIYAELGGSSPLLANTERQATALAAELGGGFKVFVAMRYWHPRVPETISKVIAWQPDRVILLPLYPQLSTTTTGSSVVEWRAAAKQLKLTAPETLVCCYPEEPGFVAAVAERLREAFGRLADPTGPRRVLFSAHGLPERVVAAGDPYQWQVERSVGAIARLLGLAPEQYQVCYQSRVGPLRWIGPATDVEIRRAGQDKVPVVLVPISFVSEHSETLVELDIEYRHLAEQSGVPDYVRVATVDTLPDFIGGLAGLVRRAEATPASEPVLTCGEVCPRDRLGCALHHGRAA
jgi:ferrochelatase